MPPLAAKNLPKIGKKREKIKKNREKRGKIGKKRQKSGRFFTLPLLTDSAGYATGTISNSHNINHTGPLFSKFNVLYVHDELKATVSFR